MTVEQFRATRGDAKRAAVLSAARRTFAVRGFAETSTLEIANQAGVSTATLYRHFPTKLDLFAAVLDDAVATLAASLSAGGVRGIEDLCSAYATLLAEPETRSLIRLAIGATDVALARRFYESGKAATSDVFASAVAGEVASGRVRDGADPGQLMGMIEHPTLLLGLLAGDHRPPAQPPVIIAESALTTWRARFGL